MNITEFPVNSVKSCWEVRKYILEIRNCSKLIEQGNVAKSRQP